MTGRRKIIVSMATSADGFIARRDGGVDWLDRPRPKGFYGMGDFMKSIDTLLMGRKTWDFAAAMGGSGGGAGGTRTYVFSRRPPKDDAPGMEYVREPIPEFAQRLRASPGKDVWMMGGGEITAAFLDAGEIDELILHVVPTFIGEGIPLLAPRHRTVPLTLLDTRPFEDGVVRLHYGVDRAGARPPRATGAAKRRPRAARGKSPSKG